MNEERQPLNGAAKLPPIAQSMLDLLSDGEAHTVVELKGLLNDSHELTPDTNIQPHLSILRRHLQPERRAILCEGSRLGSSRRTYRIVSYAKVAR